MVALVALGVLVAGCGGGPDASVGVGRVDDAVVVRAKACGGDGIARVDVVDPGAPEEPVWSATATSPGSAVGTVPVVTTVDGYAVEDRRPGGELPDRRLRVLVEGPDDASWGGPRFVPSDLVDGSLRVAGRDVDLDEWESEPARCPDVGLADALVGGAVTALVAGLLWVVVRSAARLVRRPAEGGGRADGPGARLDDEPGPP